MKYLIKNKNQSLFLKVMTTTLFILLLSEYYNYTTSKQSELNRLDQQLKSAVDVAQMIVGDHIHSQGFEREPLSQIQYRASAEGLTELAQNTGMVYIYSMVKDKTGVIRFITSSDSLTEEGKIIIENFYWVSYDEANARLTDVFETGNSSFVQYSDRWGNFRSYFKAFKTPTDRVYVIGADIALSSLIQIRNSTLRSAGRNLAIIMLILAIWAYVLSKSKKVVEKAMQRQDLALSVGSIAIWEWDVRTNKLYISDSLFLAIGFEKELIPKSTTEILNLVHPDDVKKVESFALEVMRSKNAQAQYFDYEFRIANPKQQYIWLISRGKNVKWDMYGVPTLRIGTLENITQFKTQRIELESVNDRLKKNISFVTSLLNNIPDLVSLKDSDGRYLLVNQSLKYVFDKDPSEVIGTSDFEHFSIPIAEHMFRNDQSVFQSNERVVVTEWINFKRQAESRLIETIKLKINDPMGRPAVLSIGRDITKLNSLIEDLRMHKQFAVHSAQGLFILSLQGEIKYLNAKAKEIINYGEQVTPSHSLIKLDLYDELAREKIKKQLDFSVIPENGSLIELELHSSGKRLRHLFFVIKNDKDIPIFIGLVLTDITSQHLLKRQIIEAKNKAEEANRSKSIFLANMSHEIRTPLNAIIGFSQILNDNVKLDVETLQMVNKIFKAGNQLLLLINDIIDLAKIESSAVAIKNESCNISGLLKDAYSMFTQQAKLKNLQYEFHSELPKNCEAKTDKQKLSQIVINLLSNAIKFTHSGKVTLTARPINGDHVEILVEDTGMGIDDAEANVVFEQFAQGEAGLGSGKGTGLGMALTKNLVELLDGKITFKSTLSAGTTFSVQLPMIFSNSEKSSLSNCRLTIGCTRLIKSRSCAVIDDDSNSMDVMRHFLISLGFNVWSSTDPIKAKDHLTTHPVDAVFTDIRMPKLNGDQLMLAIKKHNDNTLFFAVSASSLMHERSHFLKLGFDDFLSKPVSFGELIQMIQRYDGFEMVTPRIKPALTPPSDEQEYQLSKSDITALQNCSENLKAGNYDQAEVCMQNLSRETMSHSVFEKVVALIDRYNSVRAIEEIEQFINTVKHQ